MKKILEKFKDAVDVLGIGMLIAISSLSFCVGLEISIGNYVNAICCCIWIFIGCKMYYIICRHREIHKVFNKINSTQEAQISFLRKKVDKIVNEYCKNSDSFVRFSELPHIDEHLNIVKDWGYVPTLYYADGKWHVTWILCEGGNQLYDFEDENIHAVIWKAREWCDNCCSELTDDSDGTEIRD